MKKQIKIIMILIMLVLGVIVVDTFQAVVLKHSPFIHIQEKIYSNGSYVDKGILVDAYYCVIEENDIEFHIKTKFNTYKCKTKEEHSKYIGQWIADGTQHKTIVSVDSSGNPVYADDYEEPYHLLVNDDSTYSLTLSDKNGVTEKGKYEASGTEITFMPDNNNPLWYCELLNDELNCNLYATFKKN